MTAAHAPRTGRPATVGTRPARCPRRRRHRPGADPDRARDPRAHQRRARPRRCSASRPAASRSPAGWPPASSAVEGATVSGRLPRHHDVPRRPAAAAGARPRPAPRSRPAASTAALVVLVDDVLFSGRTIRAALDALDELGPAARRAARRAGRPRPPRAADPRRLRRQEPADLAGASRCTVLLEENDGATRCCSDPIDAADGDPATTDGGAHEAPPAVGRPTSAATTRC